MQQSIKEQILAEIRGKKQGWAFSATDFIQKYKRENIDVALTDLFKSGDIRRVIRGIYDYPMYSSILGRQTAPDIHQIAKALARKFNWSIYPDGDTALNYLGLSTQMVAKTMYLSDGPSKKYDVNGMSLEFKHISKKELTQGSENATLVIQAIRATGEKQITDDFIKRLSAKFSNAEWGKIASESSYTTTWIYDVIKKARTLAEEEHNG